MLGAFYTGVSGLKLHQLWIDIIGNNISNLDTVGYKKSRISFEDLFNETIKLSLPPREGLGGVNISQVGLGSRLANVETVHTQGKLQTTDSAYDLSIEGKGFFILSDGITQIFRYTRAGNFDFDVEGSLVNKSNGYKVLGWTAERDRKTDRLILDQDNKTIINTTKQVEGIKINYDDIMPGRITKNIDFGGELNSNNPLPIEPLRLIFTKDISSEVSVTEGRGIDINKTWKEAGFTLTPNGTITINGATFRLDIFNTPKALMEAINHTAGLGISIEYDNVVDKFYIRPKDKGINVELSEEPDRKGHGFFTQIKILPGSYNTGGDLKIEFEHLLDPINFNAKYFRWKAIEPKSEKVIETNAYYHVHNEKLINPRPVENRIIGTYQTSQTEFKLRIINLPHPDVDPTTLKVRVGGEEVPQGRIASPTIPHGFMFLDNAGEGGVDAIEFYGLWRAKSDMVGLPISVEYARVGYQMEHSTVDPTSINVKINGEKIPPALYRYNKNAGDEGRDLIVFYSAASLSDVVTNKLNLEKRFQEAGFNRNLPGTPLWNEITTLTPQNYIQVLWSGQSWTSQPLTSYNSVNSFILDFNTALSPAGAQLTYNAIEDVFILKTTDNSIRIRQNVADGFLTISGLPLPPNTSPTTYLNVSANTELRSIGEVVRDKLDIEKSPQDAGFNNFSNSMYLYSSLVISWLTENGNWATWRSNPLNAYFSVASFINAVNQAVAIEGEVGSPAPITINYDKTQDRFVLSNTNPTTKISQSMEGGILSVLKLFKEDPGRLAKTLPTSLATRDDVVTADYNFHKIQKAEGILQLNEEGRVINNFIDTESAVEVSSFDEVVKGEGYLDLAGDFSQLQEGRVDGRIIIKTLSGTYISEELNTTNYPTLRDLIDEINRSPAGVTLIYNPIDDKFTLRSNREDNDIIYLYQTSKLGFFSQIKLPTSIAIIGGNNNLILDLDKEKPLADSGWRESTGLGNTGKDYFVVNLGNNIIKDELLGPPTYGTQVREVADATELAGASVTLQYADAAKETIRVMITYDGVTWIEYPYDESGVAGWRFEDNAGAGGVDKIVLPGVLAGVLAGISVDYTRLNAYEFKVNDIAPDTLRVKIDGIIQNPYQGKSQYIDVVQPLPSAPIEADYYFEDNKGRGGVDRIIFNKSFGRGNITVDYIRTRPLAVDIFIPAGNRGPEDIKFQVNTKDILYPSGATPNIASKDLSQDLNQTELKKEAEYLYTTREKVYDALGVGYDIKINFERLGKNLWLWQAINPITEDKLSGYGILRFKDYGVYDKDNSVIFGSPSDPSPTNKFQGLYFSPTEKDGEVKITPNFEKLIQYLSAENTASVVKQDGYATGRLLKDTLTIDSRGVVTAQFDNGKILNLAQIALAFFRNEEGLAKISANTFIETVNSGKAEIDKPGRDGRGNIGAFQLEMSNVNLAEEFANLIIAQRAFEANSRTIITADNLLRALLEMRR